MTIPFAKRALLPLALLALLTACERPTGPPPPKAEVATAAGQAGPSTPASRAAASAPAAGDRPAQVGGTSQALRDFQSEQERRDRELLDQDLSEAQLRAREDSWASDATPREALDSGREPYVLPREDGDWSPSDRLPPDDLPPDDEPPYDDEPPFDEPPYDDQAELDDGYDPRDGAYRP